MVAISPLKFSFGISVLLHGLVIGVAAWLGQFHRTAAVAEVGNLAILELIAAPATTPAILSESPPETVMPPALPEPVPGAVGEPNLPTPPITPQTFPGSVVTPLSAVAELTPPTSLTPVASIVEAEVRSQAPAPIGDGTSALPGTEVTTASGRPTALAQPNYLRNQEPEYPLAARRRGQQGVVLLEVTVSPAGRATAVTVKETSGFELLDRAALRAVAEYEFEPARLGATAVASKIEVPIRFKLNR